MRATIIDHLVSQHPPRSNRPVTDKRQRECYIICQVTRVRLNGTILSETVRLRTWERRLLADRFCFVSSGPAPRSRPRWAPVSPAYCYWQARFTPSIRTNVSPSTCIPLGEYKMAPRRPACLRLRKPRTVFSGFHLIPRRCTDLTVFGFFPGLCLPTVIRSTLL